MRSDNVKKGIPTAPNRSLFYALGYTREELERPLIGVVCSYNEIVPGHMNLDKIAEAVKAGVWAAGGTPIEFPAIAVCDGIAMGHVGMKHSLVTRVLPYEQTKANMKAALTDIQNGKFAGQWIAENKNGRTFFNASRRNLAKHQMETVGAELRKNMLWGDDADPDTASN